MRAYAQVLFTSLPTELLIPYIHPNFYSLHDMPPEVSPSAHPSTSPPLPALSSPFITPSPHLLTHHPTTGRNPRTQRKTPPASPSPPLVREIRKTRVISHRGWTEHVSVGREGRGAAAYDRCVWVSGLWGFEEREGTCYAITIYAQRIRMVNSSPLPTDLPPTPPQPLLATNLRPHHPHPHHPPTRRISPAPVRRQGGWGRPSVEDEGVERNGV